MHLIQSCDKFQNKLECVIIKYLANGNHIEALKLRSTFGKSILQVPDTGTRVLDNTRPFLRSSIVSF